MEIIVGVLITCHTQYTWDRSICIFFFLLFNRTTFQVFVTYLIGALYVNALWFYKHQHDNRVHSKLSVACQRWWFQWRFWFVPSVPGYLREKEEHKPDPWRNPIERNKKKKIHIFLSQVYCVWQVAKTPTIISNNPVFSDFHVHIATGLNISCLIFSPWIRNSDVLFTVIEKLLDKGRGLSKIRKCKSCCACRGGREV